MTTTSVEDPVFLLNWPLLHPRSFPLSPVECNLPNGVESDSLVVCNASSSCFDGDHDDIPDDCNPSAGGGGTSTDANADDSSIPGFSEESSSLKCFGDILVCMYSSISVAVSTSFDFLCAAVVFFISALQTSRFEERHSQGQKMVFECDVEIVESCRLFWPELRNSSLVCKNACFKSTDCIKKARLISIFSNFPVIIPPPVLALCNLSHYLTKFQPLVSAIFLKTEVPSFKDSSDKSAWTFSSILSCTRFFFPFKSWINLSPSKLFQGFYFFDFILSLKPSSSVHDVNCRSISFVSCSLLELKRSVRFGSNLLMDAMPAVVFSSLTARAKTKSLIKATSQWWQPNPNPNEAITGGLGWNVTPQELSLEYNNDLSGGFPSFPENGSLRMISVADTQFSGSLPPSISKLSNLSRIDLSSCNFGGSIPSTMTQLTSLTYVDFSYNNFIGLIPYFLSSKNLTESGVSPVTSSPWAVSPVVTTAPTAESYTNTPSVGIPDAPATESASSQAVSSASTSSAPRTSRSKSTNTQRHGPLSSKHFEGLSKIVSINLGSNFLYGRIPSSLLSLPSLHELYLSNNLFDGLGDEYVNVSTSQLQWLDLNSNRLNGSFPEYFFEFPMLSYLFLSSNSLSGKIQSSLFSLPSLQTLDLAINSFDGLGDEYVNVSTSQLETLNLRSNRLNESFPKYFFEFPKLSELLLSSNSLSGKIQSSLFSLPSLQTLDLAINSFDGLGDEYVNVSTSQLETLNLRSNRLNESFPKYFFEFPKLSELLLSSNSLIGRIQSSLFSLPSLQTLDLSNNSFDGLDDEYVNVSASQLETLYLCSNHLNESFPQYFFEFPKLSELLLYSNSLSGRIQSSLFSLPSLQTLDLSNNSFDGLDDEYVNISASQLETLDFSSNHLSGSLPKYFFEFPMLSNLHLSSNSLSGKIPSSMFSLPSLLNLDLSSNSFDGLIDEYVNASTSQLESLYLSSNHLNGSFLEYFFKFPKLSDLDLSSNSLGGKIPLSMFSFPSLWSLDLSNNSFDGIVDGYVNASTSQLESLDLSSNHLNGSFPEYFFKFPKLSDLDLSSNFLGGKIPLSIFSLPSLLKLDLSSNSFNGLVDGYDVNASTSQLKSLDLSSNRLNGSFPEYFFEFSMLSDLHLSFNSLGEMIEFESLQKLTNLEVLDLSNNEIRGEIPSWIWELGNGTLYHLNLSCNFLESLENPYTIPSSLIVLDLHSNQLQGPLPIPPASSDGFGPIHLDYSHNFFNGSIPFGLGSFARNAYFLSLANNSFTGTIPESICNASYLEILDLSDNKLGDTLPSCLFNSFNRLGVLNLGKNQIYGSVPDSFTINCTLQTLDLSRNSFEGKIPKSLINCSLLEVLNVGNNNIVDTFPCSLKNLTSLCVLVLRSNNFHGDLHCVDANHMWPHLQIIDIASNNFSEKLSPKFLNWKRMIIDEDTAQSGQYIMFNHMNGYLNVSYEYYQDILMIEFDGGPSEIKWEYVTSALGFAVGLGAYVWMLLHNKRCREAYQQLDEVLIRLFGPDNVEENLKD
nr:receptor-like protein 12 [Ipomoea batatas]